MADPSLNLGEGRAILPEPPGAGRFRVDTKDRYASVTTFSPVSRDTALKLQPGWHRFACRCGYAWELPHGCATPERCPLCGRIDGLSEGRTVGAGSRARRRG